MRSAAAVLALGLLTTAAPAALVVSTATTQNVNCTNGVCTATAADAVLNVADLRALLAAGDVTLVSGGEAQDIEIAAAFKLKGPHGLALDAWRGIAASAHIDVNGRGPVTLITNDGGAEGNVSFNGGGQLSFRDTNGQLFVNGKRYMLIGDIAQLGAAVAQDAQQNIALAGNIDAAGHVYSEAPVPTEYDGNLDGLGHKIANLEIANTDRRYARDVALFRVLGAKGVVRNLHLTGAKISRMRSRRGLYHAAVLAGASAGKIRNVTVENAAISTVFGSGYYHGCAAGLVGSNTGVVDHVLVARSTIASSGLGGIACENGGSIVSSGANIHGQAGYIGFAGGLVDDNAGTISLSWATGELRGGNGSTGAGGLVAKNTGTIESSWADARVFSGFTDEGEVHSFDAHAGGFAVSNSGTVRNAYFRGIVQTVYTAFAGEAAGFVHESLASGRIDQAYTASKVKCLNRDGRCKLAPFVIEGCPNGAADYWDISLKKGEGDDCPGLSGLTDDALKAQLPDGFDPAVWGQDAAINGGYPYLLANPPR